MKGDEEELRMFIFQQRIINRFLPMKLSRISFLSFSLFISIITNAQELPLTWENIFTKNYGVRQAAISPDGSKVIFTARTVDQSGLFIIPSNGGDEPTFWTSGSSPVWFDDGRRVLYSYQGDLWTKRIRSGSKPVRITNDEYGERAARPSPDGSQIAFYSTRGGHNDIWIVPADGSAEPRQLTNESMANDDFRFAPAWSPDGKQIAFYSNKADYWEDDIWLINIESGKERQISKKLMAMSTPVWSPDGSKIALMAVAKDEYWYEDLSYIYILEPEKGTEEILDMQIHATDLLHNHTVKWSADGSEIFFPYQERSEVELWRVPSQGGVATRVTNMGGTFRSYHSSKRATRFIFVRSNSTRGNEVDMIRLSGGSPVQLTNVSTKWEGLVEPTEISYRSYDGLYIQAYRFNPPNFNPRNEYPALVMVHGGGTNTAYKQLNLTEQYLAQQGYIVLIVNYRGGSGFGRPFQDLGTNDWGHGQALDAAHAATFIREQDWSNGKVGIYGYSYGGITSMAAISQAPNAFNAAVPMAGIYDFSDAYTNADRLGKIFIKTGHSGSPEEKPEIYAVSNALSRVHQVRTPLLIMHGEKDVRAPFRQYELAVEILKKEGKVFESHSYPGEPHGFRNPMNRVDMYQRLEAWFKRWLK